MALTGIFGAPIEALKTLLANVTAFHTFTGTANPTAALARVVTLIKAEENVTRPLALVTYQQGDWSAARDAVSAGSASFNRSSGLSLIFEKEVDDYEPATVETFINSVSDVVTGMMNISGTSSYMLIQNISLEGFFEAEEGQDKMLTAVFKIGWQI